MIITETLPHIYDKFMTPQAATTILSLDETMILGSQVSASSLPTFIERKGWKNEQAKGQ
jgi:hypothetical protein